jgi:dCMP deaminase
MTEERKHEQDLTYMKMAKVMAEFSYCVKKKVGALLVKNNRIIANGINGAPQGEFDEHVCEGEDGKTLWKTLHAESNVISSMAASTQSSEGSTMYITCSPCKDCAKLMLQSKIIRVVYSEEYKDLDGVNFLKERGVIVDQIQI